MEIRMYVVNAFVKEDSNELLQGNPAAVALLTREQNDAMTDEQRQRIAAEMNLSETAYVVPIEGADNTFSIRWFTPKLEVDLCGHATLASAAAVVQEKWTSGDFTFVTEKRGKLFIKQKSISKFVLDFPALGAQGEVSEGERALLQEGLGTSVTRCMMSDYDVVCFVKDVETLRHLQPCLEMLSKADARGIIATARGEEDDETRIYSRFFAPRAGISEDPVTGSAHAILAPLFLEDGERGICARQLSQRGGWLKLSLKGKVVEIWGNTRVIWHGLFQA